MIRTTKFGNVKVLDLHEGIEDTDTDIAFYEKIGILHKKVDNALISALVPCKMTCTDLYTKAGLLDGKSLTSATVKVSEIKIPADLFSFVMRYFQQVYEKQATECAVLLFFHTGERKWQVLVPYQYGCSGGSVKYVIPATPVVSDKAITKEEKEQWAETRKEYLELVDAGYSLYGTIHSHCNFSAFHSSVDDSDEMDFDGLHITIGNVKSDWSYSARIIVQGQAVSLEPEDYVDTDIELVEEMVDEFDVPDFYIDRCNEATSFSWSGKPHLLSQGSLYGTAGNDDYTPTYVPHHGYNTPYTSWQDKDDEPTIWDENDIVAVFHIPTGDIKYTRRQDWLKGGYKFVDYELIKESVVVPDDLINQHLAYVEKEEAEQEKDYGKSMDDTAEHSIYEKTPEPGGYFLRSNTAGGFTRVPMTMGKARKKGY